MMNANELNVNELDQVNGGGILIYALAFCVGWQIGKALRG